MPEPPIDVSKANRWFAIEFNNAAWDVIESESPTAEDLEALVHVAHASVHHWCQTGEPINHQRGLSLLTTVYAKLGNAERALHYAEACLAMCEAGGDEQSAFDKACAHGGMVTACGLAGRTEDAGAAHAKMTALFDDLDADTRSLLEKLYPAP